MQQNVLPLHTQQQHGRPTWKKAYLGFMIVMGVNCLPEIREYCSKLNNTIFFQITHKCFEEISWYLHFAENTKLPLRDEPGFHQLQKVMPTITAMRERFDGNYNPHPQNSIDEAMILFKGMHIHYNVHAHLLEVTR